MNTNLITPVIDALLNAKKVVVVGASANPEKWGYKFIKNIIEAGFQGVLYGVNPREKEILGITVYPSIAEIPSEVDLLIICIPAPYVLEVIRQGIAKQAKGAVLVTSGFREVGRIDLEDEIIAAIKGHDFRVIGPNIAGFNFLPNHFNPNVTMQFEKNGPISIVSQSGSISAILAEWAEGEGIGIAGLINLGNQIDLCESDFIEYFMDHEQTRVISLYLEGPKNGNRFKELLRKTAARKPIVVLKPGKTSAGRKAALSHTASMAGNDIVFSSACSQLGIVRAKDLESFYDFTKIFALMPLPQGNRVLVITSSGGIASLTVDEFGLSGLELAELPAIAVEELKEKLTVGGANFSQSLIDMPSFNPHDYLIVAEIISRYDVADSILFVFADPVPGIELIMPEIIQVLMKPVVVIYVGAGETGKTGSIKMIESGIPVYLAPERGVRSLGQAVWYEGFRRNRENG